MTSLSVTCIETRHYQRSAEAVQRTISCLPAGSVDCVYWFSNADFPVSLPGIEIIRIDTPCFTHFIDDINRLCLRIIPRVVTTDHTLVVQSDGFAVNPDTWDPEFLNYDYIGACWPCMWDGPRSIVGNGGFSLRSQRLLKALREINVRWQLSDWEGDPRLDQRDHYVLNPDKSLPEDILVCQWYRPQLEADYGIKFCPVELANKFSVESIHPVTQSWLGKSFGFHGVTAAPYYGVSL